MPWWIFPERGFPEHSSEFCDLRTNHPRWIIAKTTCRIFGCPEPSDHLTSHMDHIKYVRSGYNFQGRIVRETKNRKSQTQCSGTLCHVTDLLSFGVTVVYLHCVLYSFCPTIGESLIRCDKYILVLLCSRNWNEKIYFCQGTHTTNSIPSLWEI